MAIRKKTSSKSKLSKLLIQEWHPTKNERQSPTGISPGSHLNAWWQCTKALDHTWQATVRDRSHGNGCPFCSGRRADSKTSFEVKHPAMVLEWHPTKNGERRPSDFLPQSNQKFWWICPKSKEHDYEATLNNRVGAAATGCPFCSGRNVNATNSLQTLFPAIGNEWHPTKNGALTSELVSANSGKRVWWECSKGHEWEAIIASRAGDRGCPFCSNKRVCADNCLKAVDPILASEWHPTKNGNLTPMDVTPGVATKVWWLCQRDPSHSWIAAVYSRTAGRGCPECRSSTSQAEIRLLAELRFIFGEVEHRKKINGIECDLFIPSLNLGIELDGGHWHKEHVARDMKKNEGLSSRGVKLIRIRGRGLAPLTDLDLSLPIERQLTPKETTTLLIHIRNTTALSSVVQNKIDIYAREMKFQQNDLFQVLQAKLPGPMPGESFSEHFPELSKQWHPTKNGALTPDRISKTSGRRVWWRCSTKNDKHDWHTSPAKRTSGKGTGCPACANKKIIPGENSLLAKFPEIGKEWHPTKNGTYSADQAAPRVNELVWWICPIGGPEHDYKMLIANRTRLSQKCPYCSNRRVTSENSLEAVRPDLAAQWHPTKNLTLRPDGIVSGSHKEVWWLCPKVDYHEWPAKVIDRVASSGCPFCSSYRLHPRDSLAGTAPEIAAEWHPAKNSHIKAPSEYYRNSMDKVWWLCKKDSRHEWDATINNRYDKKRGCPYCARQRVLPEDSLAVRLPDIATELHPTKNPDINPMELAPGSGKNLWWKCSKNPRHVWQMRVIERTTRSKKGCPDCKARGNRS